MKKITLFTSNRSYHICLINELSKICDILYVIQECGTCFPLERNPSWNGTPIRKRYFSKVNAAERKVFNSITFIHGNVKQIALQSGDINLISRDIIQDSLESDYYIVNGVGYLKGWLADFLIEHKAVNLHSGILPYYRGSSSNFWAIYDRNIQYVPLVKQNNVFLNREGDAWFNRNREALDKAHHSDDIVVQALERIMPLNLDRAIKILEIGCADGAIRHFDGLKNLVVTDEKIILTFNWTGE